MEPNISHMLDLLSFPSSKQLLNPTHLIDIFKDLITLNSDQAVSILLDSTAHTYIRLAQLQSKFLSCRLCHIITIFQSHANNYTYDFQF